MAQQIGAHRRGRRLAPFVTLPRRSMSGSKFPPGPSGRIWATSLFTVRKGPLHFFPEQVRRYGNISRAIVGTQTVWILNDPDYIHDVLVANAAKFAKGRALERAKIFLGESLLTSEGDIHRRQRRLVQPSFHRSRLRSYAETMTALAQRTRDQWNDGAIVDIAEEMNRLTLAIVGRTLFSTNVEAEAKTIGEALTVMMSGFNRLMLPFAPLLLRLPFPASRRIRKAHRTLDETIYRLIRDRRASGQDAGDLLSTLVFTEDADHPGERLSDEEIRDQAMTLFLAGHETTANALAWTWSLLAQSPNVDAKLAAELSSVLKGRPPTLEDIRQLPYVEKVAREGMRLYPPAWLVGRRAREDHEIGGYMIEAGNLVVASQWVMHRDARYYPDPTTFDPDRWTEPFTEALPKFAYFPFGGGPRICIGESFAWMELSLVIATLAQHWRFHVVPGFTPEPLPRITLRSKNGIKLRLERRM